MGQFLQYAGMPGTGETTLIAALRSVYLTAQLVARETASDCCCRAGLAPSIGAFDCARSEQVALPHPAVRRHQRRLPELSDWSFGFGPLAYAFLNSLPKSFHSSQPAGILRGARIE